VLTGGCQHAPRCCCQTCGTPASGKTVPSVLPNPTTYAPNALGKPSVPEGGILPIVNETPAVHTAAKPVAPAVPEVSVVTGDRIAPALPTVEPGVVQMAINPYREGTVPRRTFTDITAHPKFAHDPNYRWLVGRLDYSKIQRSWVLRFASVEEDDRYGGSVTLVDTGRMATFKSGDLVRVEGSLVDPESQQPRPPFRAQSIRPVEP
jgi:hypothetical protein